MERVVAAPRHPYTQLLISAIPRAHVARDWLVREEDSGRNGLAVTAAGCRFADRCPHTMPACLAAAPGLYRTEPRRAVAFIQYQNYPTLPPGISARYYQCSASRHPGAEGLNSSIS